jgi:hypothetical protein
MKETEDSKSKRKWSRFFRWTFDVILQPFIDTAIVVSSGFLLRHIVVDLFGYDAIENWLKKENKIENKLNKI